MRQRWKSIIWVFTALIACIGVIAACGVGPVVADKSEEGKWTQIGVSMYRMCDKETGNLVYTNDKGLFVVKDGCKTETGVTYGN